MTQRVTIVGAGLAGCEAAWRLARAGIEVELVEMKPDRRSPAHLLDGPCELVCSNSLRSDNPQNAVGLLHEELRRVGSLVLQAADQTRVPAGDALAVDRVRFSALVAERLASHPGLSLARREQRTLPEGPGLAILCTGPLTGDDLAAELQAVAGGRLHFYDAIAPIVADHSIDRTIAYARSRWDKGSGADYLNLPLDEAQYRAFVGALLAGEKVKPHGFEEPRYFEGCLPIEVMAERGAEVLAHGPMKPVGLEDPRTGRRPHAVVQLRREDAEGTAWNLVGFQTRLTWPEQRRIFRAFLPGLAGAEFVRLGQVHRNTFVEAPRVLSPDLSLRERPHLFLAGQITGVEGYVESAACGHLAARAVLDRLAGRPFDPPPAATALGALYRHLTGQARVPGVEYQPTNVVYSLFPPLPGRVRGGAAARKQAHLERARREVEPWDGSTVSGRARLALAAGLLLGCSRGGEPASAAAGQGSAAAGQPAAASRPGEAPGSAPGQRLVASGPVRSLFASADGAWLAWLDGCQELQGRFLPPGTASCDLEVAPAAGGAPSRVARGVSTLPHGVLVAPAGGAFAALAEYDHATGAGTLVLVRGGAGRDVAEGVTFVGFLPGAAGALLAVARGGLVAVRGDGAARAIPGTEGVTSFSVAPPPLEGRAVAVLARRPAAAGGGLLAIGPDLERARPVATGTLDFALGAAGAFAYTTGRPDCTELWRGGDAPPVRVARGAQAFAFSPDGAALAWTGAADPGRPGDLLVGRPGAPPERLGPQVGDHRWAAAGQRLAWLEKYDQGTRTGVLATARLGGLVRRVGRGVSAFELAPDGRSLAYLRHSSDGGYSVDLELVALEGSEGAARRVARGVFGFAFSPDGRWLLYRTRCTRQAEACDLERVPADAPAGGAVSPTPELLAPGSKSFEFDPLDPSRLLLTWQRADSTALDVAVWQGRLVAVDQGVLPGSARFLGPDSRRVAYAVALPKRAGVRVAELPPP